MKRNGLSDSAPSLSLSLSRSTMVQPLARTRSKDGLLKSVSLSEATNSPTGSLSATWSVALLGLVIDSVVLARSVNLEEADNSASSTSSAWDKVTVTLVGSESMLIESVDSTRSRIQELALTVGTGERESYSMAASASGSTTGSPGPDAYQ